MKVSFLRHTMKSSSMYSYTYILITNSFSISDILESQKQGKKIVFFGSSIESHVQWEALHAQGIAPDYACDILCEIAYSNHGVKMVPFWELLQEASKYYFIITVSDPHAAVNIMKMLFYAGLDEFGIVYSHWSKDFAGVGCKKLASAFYDTINEVYEKEPLFCNYTSLENLRRTSLEGAGYWDFLYKSIYIMAKKEKFTRYLEFGSGTGIMSIALKKLLEEKIQISWVNLPVVEGKWSENNSSHFMSLLQKYNIEQHFRHLEIDDINDLGPEQFDCIVLAQVMEHFVYHPVPTFKKIASLLSQNGFLYVAVPEETKWYNVRTWKDMPFASEQTPEMIARRMAINDYGHFYEYSREEAEEIFESSGLSVVFYTWNFPIHFFVLRKSN